MPRFVSKTPLVKAQRPSSVKHLKEKSATKKKALKGTKVLVAKTKDKQKTTRKKSSLDKEKMSLTKVPAKDMATAAAALQSESNPKPLLDMKIQPKEKDSSSSSFLSKIGRLTKKVLSNRGFQVTTSVVVAAALAAVYGAPHISKIKDKFLDYYMEKKKFLDNLISTSDFLQLFDDNGNLKKNKYLQIQELSTIRSFISRCVDQIISNTKDGINTFLKPFTVYPLNASNEYVSVPPDTLENAENLIKIVSENPDFPIDSNQEKILENLKDIGDTIKEANKSIVVLKNAEIEVVESIKKGNTSEVFVVVKNLNVAKYLNEEPLAFNVNGNQIKIDNTYLKSIHDVSARTNEKKLQFTFEGLTTENVKTMVVSQKISEQSSQLLLGNVQSLPNTSKNQKETFALMVYDFDKKIEEFKRVVESLKRAGFVTNFTYDEKISLNNNKQNFINSVGVKISELILTSNLSDDLIRSITYLDNGELLNTNANFRKTIKDLIDNLVIDSNIDNFWKETEKVYKNHTKAMINGVKSIIETEMKNRVEKKLHVRTLDETKFWESFKVEENEETLVKSLIEIIEEAVKNNDINLMIESHRAKVEELFENVSDIKIVKNDKRVSIVLTHAAPTETTDPTKNSIDNYFDISENFLNDIYKENDDNDKRVSIVLTRAAPTETTDPTKNSIDNYFDISENFLNDIYKENDDILFHFIACRFLYKKMVEKHNTCQKIVFDLKKDYESLKSLIDEESTIRFIENSIKNFEWVAGEFNKENYKNSDVLKDMKTQYDKYLDIKKELDILTVFLFSIASLNKQEGIFDKYNMFKNEKRNFFTEIYLNVEEHLNSLAEFRKSEVTDVFKTDFSKFITLLNKDNNSNPKWNVFHFYTLYKILGITYENINLDLLGSTSQIVQILVKKVYWNLIRTNLIKHNAADSKPFNFTLIDDNRDSHEDVKIDRLPINIDKLRTDIKNFTKALSQMVFMKHKEFEKYSKTDDIFPLHVSKSMFTAKNDKIKFIQKFISLQKDAQRFIYDDFNKVKTFNVKTEILKELESRKQALQKKEKYVDEHHIFKNIDEIEKKIPIMDISTMTLENLKSEIEKKNTTTVIKMLFDETLKYEPSNFINIDLIYQLVEDKKKKNIDYDKIWFNELLKKGHNQYSLSFVSQQKLNALIDSITLFQFIKDLTTQDACVKSLNSSSDIRQVGCYYKILNEVKETLTKVVAIIHDLEYENGNLKKVHDFVIDTTSAVIAKTKSELSDKLDILLKTSDWLVTEIGKASIKKKPREIADKKNIYIHSGKISKFDNSTYLQTNNFSTVPGKYVQVPKTYLPMVDISDSTVKKPISKQKGKNESSQNSKISLKDESQNSIVSNDNELEKVSPRENGIDANDVDDENTGENVSELEDNKIHQEKLDVMSPVNSTDTVSDAKKHDLVDIPTFLNDKKPAIDYLSKLSKKGKKDNIKFYKDDNFFDPNSKSNSIESRWLTGKQIDPFNIKKSIVTQESQNKGKVADGLRVKGHKHPENNKKEVIVNSDTSQNVDYKSEKDETKKVNNQDKKLFNGKGLFTYRDGSTYDGEWKDGEKDGKGLYTYSDGSTYDGEWKNDQINGQGVYTYFADKSTYDGHWKDGKRNGQGLYTNADKSTYDGEWKDGKMHGQGVYKYAEGSTFKGRWEDGKRIT